MVHAKLTDGLDRAARAAGQGCRHLRAAVLAECLQAASTTPLGWAGASSSQPMAPRSRSGFLIRPGRLYSS